MIRGAHIDAFAYCPHHPEAGTGPFTRACDCRKPAPGMIFDLADRWSVDLSRSALIGDKHLDLRTACNAGITEIAYGGGSVLKAIDNWLTSLPNHAPFHSCSDKIGL